MNNVKISSDPEQVPLSLIDPATGKALRYELPPFLNDWIETLFAVFSNHLWVRAGARALDTTSLDIYLKKALFLELRPIARALIRRRFLYRAGLMPVRTVSSPWDLHSMLLEGWPEPEFKVIPSNRILPIQRRLWQFGKLAISDLKRALCRRPAIPNTVGPRIAFEILERFDPQDKSDAFWLAYSKLDSDRIVALMDFTNHRCNVEDEYQKAKANNIQTICITPSSFIGGRRAVWRPRRCSPLYRQVRRALNQPWTWRDQWLKRQILTCSRRVEYWEALFREYDIRICQHDHEDGTEGEAKRIAIERIGGVLIGKQRSLFFEPEGSVFCHCQHVLFVWSCDAATYLLSHRANIRWIVVSGYPYEPQMIACRQKAKALREQLLAGGGTKVIAIYDNTFSHDGRFSRQQLLEWYQCLLDWAITTPAIALLIKPKNEGMFDSLRELEEQVAVLTRAGRCMVFREGPYTLTARSACAADLAVGFGVSTAAVEAALAGCHALVYEPTGANWHPLARKGEGRVLFRTLPAMREALDGYVAGNGKFGNMQDYLDYVDSFRDGRGSERVGVYIRWLLEALEGGHDPESAIRLVNDRYAGQWGRDKIVRVNARVE